MPIPIPGPRGATGAAGATGATGATGPAGPAGSNAAAVNWIGAWSSATAYTVGDGVTLSGSGYICTTANTNNTPPNTTYWTPVTMPSGSGWSVISANYTATAGDQLMVDTSAGAVTITLPIVSGTILIKDLKNSFGTNNCTIAAGSSQTLTGKSYSGASTVTLNAPGNNATIYCTSTVAYIEQVESGLWEQIAASAASDVAFTGLVGDTMEYEVNFNNVSTSASTQIVYHVGYGATPTYETGSVYNQVETENTSITQGTNPLANFTANTVQTWTNSTGTGWIVSSGSTVRVSVSSDYGVTKLDCVISMASSPFSAWKIYPESGTISGTFSLLWRKLNV